MITISIRNCSLFVIGPFNFLFSILFLFNSVSGAASTAPLFFTNSGYLVIYTLNFDDT